MALFILEYIIPIESQISSLCCGIIVKSTHNHLVIWLKAYNLKSFTRNCSFLCNLPVEHVHTVCITRLRSTSSHGVRWSSLESGSWTRTGLSSSVSLSVFSWCFVGLHRCLSYIKKNENTGVSCILYVQCCTISRSLRLNSFSVETVCLIMWLAWWPIVNMIVGDPQPLCLRLVSVPEALLTTRLTCYD